MTGPFRLFGICMQPSQRHARTHTRGCLCSTQRAEHPAHPHALLLPACPQVDDLAERRVDTWIRDYAGATHLLDVYRQKRVDKRKVFASNYTRLRALDNDPLPAELAALQEAEAVM
jgi:hypothetical protein